MRMGFINRRKRTVAIVGGGPAGITTAKSMLEAGLEPQVFEAQSALGGLWSCSRKGLALETSCHENMRTNLSRWKCSFGDWRWRGEHFGIQHHQDEEKRLPVFPTARDVNRYLNDYAEKFLPKGTVKLNARVTEAKLVSEKSDYGAGTGDGSEEKKWKVTWEERQVGPQGSEQAESQSNIFDHLVIASGFFVKGNMDIGVCTPDTPSWVDNPRICHSSRYNLEDLTSHLRSLPPHRENGKKQKIVVVGGCLSSVEVASRIALEVAGDKSKYPLEIVHLFPRPFWTIPYYLPISSGLQRKRPPAFLPLDFLLHEATKRRQWDAAGGSMSVRQKNRRMNEWLKQITGNGDQSQISSLLTITEEDMELPPYAAISDTYTNLVRSGEITLARGYLYTIERSSPGFENSPFTIQVSSINATPPFPEEHKDVVTENIENVAGVVYATGYSPHEAFSYLPQDILQAMEYDETNIFLPLLLYQQILHPSLISYSQTSSNILHGSYTPGIVHAGFVGIYKGPYFGVIELQGKYLAKLFTGQLPPPNLDSLNEGIQDMRILRQCRNSGNWQTRGQYSWGDYLGIMQGLESKLSPFDSVSSSTAMAAATIPNDVSARSLALPGIDKAISSSPFGDIIAPIIPSHFLYNEKSEEATLAIESLNNIVRMAIEKGLFTARGVFRSLQGKWKVHRRLDSQLGRMPSGIFVGEATFIPRKETFRIPHPLLASEEEATQEATNCQQVRIYPLPLDSSSLKRGQSQQGRKEDRYDIMGRDDLLFPMEYVYSETGTYTITANNYSFPATARYIYRYDLDRDRISVWIVKPLSCLGTTSEIDDRESAEADYHFYDLEFITGNGGEERDKYKEGILKAIGPTHLCVADLYKTRYEFGFKDDGAELEWFAIGYDVSGPKKNYTTMAKYER